MTTAEHLDRLVRIHPDPAVKAAASTARASITG
jgi:hypothetical protein